MCKQYERDLALKEDIALLVRRCSALVPERTAIILYGGFGRNEGSWFEAKPGMWQPYNDYDVCIITDRKAPNHAVKTLATSLALEIGIHWVDISQLSPRELRRLRPSIKNYDFKNASKVIYGDPTVLGLIPDIDPSTLPMKEAQILFFTRLYPLIGSLDENGVDQDLEGESTRFFRNQMAKAVLAAVDVLLLAKGAYDASYCKRVERVAEVYPEKLDFLELGRWALKEKLRPQAPPMTAREVREMYELVRHHYLTEMYCALSLRFGRRIASPKDIEFCMKWLPVSLMKRLYWVLKFRDLRMGRQISVLNAQSYLAAAWGPDCINEELLRQGVSLLRRVDNRISTGLTWDEARLEAARLRMAV